MSDMGIGEAMLISTLIGGGAAVVGGALKKRQTATPTYDPQSQNLRDLVYRQMTDRLNAPVDMAGYGASGTSGINRSFGLAKQTQDNNLSARGLATSPVAANVDATREAGRVGAVSAFQNSVPLLGRQLQGEDLNAAQNLFSSGRGITQTGGGGAAGAFENLAGYMGYLQGKGVFDKKDSPIGLPGHLDTFGLSNGIRQLTPAQWQMQLPGQLPMPGPYGTKGSY